MCKFVSEFTVKQERNCNWDPIPHRAVPYEELISWGTRHHCPMEVGAYGLKCLKQHGCNFRTCLQQTVHKHEMKHLTYSTSRNKPSLMSQSINFVVKQFRNSNPKWPQIIHQPQSKWLQWSPKPIKMATTTWYWNGNQKKMVKTYKFVL